MGHDDAQSRKCGKVFTENTNKPAPVIVPHEKVMRALLAVNNRSRHDQTSGRETRRSI